MYGRPVVASDVGPVRWTLERVGNLGPTSREVHHLTAALRSLSESSVREERGTAARRRAVETFSVEAVVVALERVVDGVLRESPRGRCDGRTDG